MQKGKFGSGIEMQSSLIAAERSLKLDNLKAILIILVVVGHFVDECVKDSSASKSLFLFMYSFHMPLFIFLNGLVCHHTLKRSQTVLEKVISLWGLYLLLKILIFSVKVVFTGKSSFYLFDESGIPWYLFALGMYYMLTFFLQRIRPEMVLFLAFMVALFCGYDKAIGDYLVLSRIIVFYPFFFVGYVVGLDQFQRWEFHSVFKIIAGVFLAVAAGITIVYIDSLYFLRPLFTGRNSYTVLEEQFYLGALYRMGTYVITILISFAIIMVVPSVKIPLLSEAGNYTLSVYFWHRPVLYVLVYSGVWDMFERNLGWRYGRWAWVMLGILLALLLARPVFERPLRWYFKAIKKKTCNWEN